MDVHSMVISLPSILRTNGGSQKVGIWSDGGADSRERLNTPP